MHFSILFSLPVTPDNFIQQSQGGVPTLNGLIKKICSIEFLKNKELKGSSRHLHLCKYLKMFTEGNSRNCKKKEEKYKKTPIFLTHCCHGNDLHKVNNNTNVIARMLLILLENFMNISHRGEKRGFLKHF